jgi:hypothetical protein
MGDKGGKSRSFASLRMTMIGISMMVSGIRVTVSGNRMTVVGMERAEAAGAIRCVARLRGKHEGFYHEIGEDVK